MSQIPIPPPPAAPHDPGQDPSLSLAEHHGLSLPEKLGLTGVGIGLLALLVAWAGQGQKHAGLLLAISLLGLSGGGALYITRSQLKKAPGIHNDGAVSSSLTGRGVAGWLVAVVLTGIYTLYYWWPDTLSGLTRMTDPLSQVMRGKESDYWFMYTLLYSVAVLVMGYRALLRYRHSRYQIIRTCSVIASQLVFAFLIPSLLKKMNEPEEYVSYFWPLNPKPLWPEHFHELLDPQYRLGTALLVLSAVLTFVVTPVLSYFYGKRWYCSWVCGCGGLANTAGDPWRHLSDKSTRAWKAERLIIYSVLAFVILTTGALWIHHHTGFMGDFAGGLKKAYGFLIIAAFAGVIGVGFYPLMGTRVWCRFGCPMAAILGIFQRVKSRFRITTNGGQCMSCGNCSTYCEMGIDVRAYAQKGEDIVRASCVGCGMCSAVCPRGVLNLENGPTDSRHADSIDLLQYCKSGIDLPADETRK